MRASRLLNLVRLLHIHGQMTATELADRLEVTQRTIFRDVEELSGAGVPIYALRGARGGIRLVEEFEPEFSGRPSTGIAVSAPTTMGTIRVAPESIQKAWLEGLLQPLRVRRSVPPDERGWLEATIRYSSLERAVAELLALGLDVEAIAPASLRDAVIARISALDGVYRRDPHLQCHAPQPTVPPRRIRWVRSPGGM